MNIAVMGAGGVGGYYGAMLARSGEDVTFIARGDHLDAIRSNGLTVKTHHVGELNIKAPATDNPGSVGPTDYVLFSVKTFDTLSASELMRPLIGSETTVLTLQNGVESPELIGSVIGMEHVLGGTTYVSAKIESPGVIKEIWDHKTFLGELDNKSSQRAQTLADMFTKAGVPIEIPPDIRSAMWGKLLAVSAFTAIGCVTRQPRGVFMACPESNELMWAAVKEGIAVAKASGAKIPDDYLDQHQSIADSMDPSLRPSMYYALEAGRPLELDGMVGVIVRQGKKHGIPTPYTFAMYAALKPYADGTPVLPE